MIIEHAFAKVTLSLRVLGTRADGYHDLDAIVVCVDEPHDTLIIKVGGDGLHVVARDPVPTGSENLVAAALSRLGIAAAVELTKAIPTEAGLGGGSADAAAIIRALRPQLDPLIRGELADIAASLGADVPVCVALRPTRMRGIGDQLEPIVGVPPVHMVLCTPAFGCSTPAVFRAWDALGAPRSTRTVTAPAGWSRISEVFSNDLEPAAIAVEPRLEQFRDELRELVGAEPILCGSGSTYAALFENRALADAAAETIRSARLKTRLVTGASSL